MTEANAVREARKPVYMSIADAAAVVEELTSQVTTLPVSELEVFTVDGAIALKFRDHMRYVTTKAVAKSMREILGIDTRLLLEYGEEPKLLEPLFRSSLLRRKDTVIRLFHDEDSVLEAQSVTSRWIDPRKVFELAVSEVKDRALGVHSVHRFSNNGLQARFVFEESKEPPRRQNDVSHAGVWFGTNGVQEVGSYCLRLVCVNGLLADYEMPRYAVDGNIESDFREAVRAAANKSSTLLHNFIGSDEQKVRDPSGWVAHFTSQFGARVLQQAVEALPVLPRDATQYDVINLITSRAQVTGDDRYEWYGSGAMQAFRNDECSHCHRPLQ